jgi:hypothetical protein
MKVGKRQIIKRRKNISKSKEQTISEKGSKEDTKDDKSDTYFWLYLL